MGTGPPGRDNYGGSSGMNQNELAHWSRGMTLAWDARSPGPNEFMVQHKRDHYPFKPCRGRFGKCWSQLKTFKSCFDRLSAVRSAGELHGSVHYQRATAGLGTID